MYNVKYVNQNISLMITQKKIKNKSCAFIYYKVFSA